MLRVLFAASAVSLLAGCASMQRPQVAAPVAPVVIHHKADKLKVAPKAAPTVVAPPVVVAPPKPATFKERYQEFKKKHPTKWLHSK